METDLPGLQPLLPLSQGHALVGLALVLASPGTIPLLIFGRQFCPLSSWRARQLRGLQSGLAEGWSTLGRVGISDHLATERSFVRYA